MHLSFAPCSDLYFIRQDDADFAIGDDAVKFTKTQVS